MRYIKLTTAEELTLREGFRNHPKHHVRQRFHALLLSHEGWSVPSIARLLKTRTRTIYTWMGKWKEIGIVGLMIKSGRGLKAKLSIENSGQVKLAKKSPEIRTKPETIRC